MGRSKLEKEVAEIIGLPNDEFTFYERGESKNFALFIHYKHFNEWIGLYQQELVLLNLGRFIIQKYNIDTLNRRKENNYISVSLKGESQAILLYKYDYTLDKLIQIKAQDEQADSGSKAIISWCDWKWF